MGGVVSGAGLAAAAEEAFMGRTRTDREAGLVADIPDGEGGMDVCLSDSYGVGVSNDASK
jgi:hypothetical protein